MAQKTIQALKISATLALHQDARVTAHHVLFAKGEALRTVAASAKMKISHAIVARYDDPEYSARVTARIASIKAALAEKGELEDWRVVAGAVPIEDAEVLTEAQAEQPADEPKGEEAPAQPPRGATADEAAASEIPGRKSRKAAAA